MNNELDLKEIMWAASRFPFQIKKGRLPKDYKTSVDYIRDDKAVNRYQKAEFLGDVYVFTAGISDVHAAIVGYSKAGIIVSCRGTEENMPGILIDWMNNFVSGQVSFAPFGNGMVHKGFLNAVTGIMDNVLQCVKDLLIKDNIRNTPQKIYVTGHSKGGAMASLMAKILRNYLNSEIIVYTFGAPRVGDETFKENYDILHYRYESFLDAVCHLSLSSQEIKLLKGLGNVKELIFPFMNLKPYATIGTGICLYKPRGRYGRYPHQENNYLSERLNSFYAVLEMVIGGELLEFIDIHENDYYD